MNASPVKACISWINYIIPIGLVSAIIYFAKKEHGFDVLDFIGRMFPKGAVLRKFVG